MNENEMIERLVYKDRNGERCFVNVVEPYLGIYSFLDLDGEIYVLFNVDDLMSKEMRRRNVFKFGEGGEMVWQVGDKIGAFKRAGHPNFEAIEDMEKEVGSCFAYFLMKDGELIVSDGDSNFIVDLNTGELEYQGTYKFQ